VRHLLLAALIFASACAARAGPRVGAAPRQTWPFLRADLSNSGHVVPGPGSAKLIRTWTYVAASRITSTPTSEGDTVYVGTWRGNVLALDAATGRVRWKTYLGANGDETYGGPRGVIGSVALDGGTAYAASGNCTLTALNAATGTRLWRTTICDMGRNDDVYSSPVVADGLVLIGIDLMADRPTDRGRELALDAATGRVRWVYEPARYTGPGSGVSASAAVDPAAGIAYIGSGNPLPMRHPPPGPDPGSDSIIALDLRTGKALWTFGPSHPHDAFDEDFFASPNLFAVTIGGRRVTVVGEGSKDGSYYAVDAATGRLLWKTRVPDASGGAAIIGAAAVGDGVVFVPLYDGNRGSLTALRARDGAVLWQEPTGPEYGGVVLWGNEVVTLETTGWLDAFAAGTGRPLGRWRVCAPAFGRGPSVARGALYVASGTCLTRFIPAG
jgi:polyvinyl alcohol dehydrogenase (cytochrome)